MRLSDATSRGALAGLTLVWLAFLLAFGGVSVMLGTPILAAVPRQARSSTFPRAPGVVVVSRVEERSDAETTSRIARVETRYSVDGRTYRTRAVDFRGGDSTSIFDENPSDVVARYPLGARVSVFYDPDAPGVGALRAGFVGSMLGFLALMTPFYLVALGLLVMPVVIWRERARGERAPIEVIARGTTKRYLLGGHWALFVLAGSIPATFIACACGSCAPVPRSEHGLGFAAFVWCVELAVIALTVAKAREGLGSGRWDLVLDSASGRLTLPADSWGGAQRTIDCRDVSRIVVDTSRETSDSEVQVVLQLRDGGAVVVYRNGSEEPCRALDALLREDMRPWSDGTPAS